MPKGSQQQVDPLLTEIAKKHLSIETLETRNSDSLDFYDVAVWALKDVLQEAYEAGETSKKQSSKVCLAVNKWQRYDNYQ